ncbi:MAG: HD domain-containing protein [Anaerolineae bacterium]|nr:HD domain-containing protein [Anaerolineae bacterium]
MTLSIYDPVYGDVTFTEPLLVDLYHSRAVQRLAHIYQGGITAFIKPERRTTRLEHSLGVAALLRRLGAGVLEQASGLLHDVPHTAFSHVIDFVFPNDEHTYHEQQRESVLSGSDLPGILTRYGLDWRYVTEAENFSLLEQPLPHLCADRLDYFLRDGVVDWKLVSPAEAQDLLDHLKVFEGAIVVDDVDIARWLAETFIKLDDLCWCGLQEVGWYAVAARALRAALTGGVITEQDFAGADEALFARLHAAEDSEVQHWLALLRPDVNFARVTDPASADLTVLPKVRAIDPAVLVGGHAVQLSRLDPAFARRRTAYVAGKQGEWALRILA